MLALLALVVAILLLNACSGGPRQISQSGAGAYEASLGVLDDGFVAAWHDTRNGHPEIYIRTLDATGRPDGPERRLTDSPNFSYEADIEVAAGDLVVAWYEETPAGESVAKVGRWTRDGEARWVHTLSTPGRDGRNPLVRAGDDALFCAWIEEADHDDGRAVWAAWLDPDGRPRSPPRRLAPVGPTTWNLNAALDDAGRAWVVFDATAGTRADELFLARVDDEAVAVSRLTGDDGVASKYPDLAAGTAGAVLTWFDERDGNREVYLHVAPLAELREGVETRADRVTVTQGESIGAYVAWNDRRVGLAWSDDSDGQHEVYFQTFDDEGAAIGGPRRLTRSPTASLIPAIEPWDDGFALVWNEDVVEERGDHRSGGRSEIVFSLTGP